MIYCYLDAPYYESSEQPEKAVSVRRTINPKGTLSGHQGEYDAIRTS